MKLIKIQLLPRGEQGWSSKSLLFGNEITSLYAPNGSGKTPIIQAIVFCLGYPVTFRQDLIEKCSTIELMIEIADKCYLISRVIDKDFYLTISDSSRQESIFVNELEYSRYIFSKFNLDIPTLISSSKQSTEPYLATVLPIFYLDQDYGYGAVYKAHQMFIRDQFCEMVRFLFQFGPKNSFNAKKELLRLKTDLEFKDQRIVALGKNINLLADELVYKDSTLDQLQEKIDSLKNDLQELKENRNVRGGAQLILENLIAEKRKHLNSNLRTIIELRCRIDGIGRIKDEINSEIDTLGLNEESRRVFVSFNEICSNFNCGLFTGSSETYAKNLLYLKDQIKDLERNVEIAQNKVEQLEEFNSFLELDLEPLNNKIDKSNTEDNIGDLIDAIGGVTSQIFELEKARKTLEIYKEQQAAYYNNTIERDKILDRINSLGKGSAQVDVEFLSTRIKLKNLIVKWLDILDTRNVSRDIAIELDLKMTFGGETLDAIKGSTKIRLILAIHAALFELYVSLQNSPFRFLILDTPRQHEIHSEDLFAYIQELKTLASNANAQIIFSSTSFNYECDDADKEWLPTFDIDTKFMYLGTLTL